MIGRPPKDLLPWMLWWNHPERTHRRKAPARTHMPRLRVLPLFVASKSQSDVLRPMSLRSVRVETFRSGNRPWAGHRECAIGRHDETATSAATDLAALATGRPRFVGTPLVGGAFFVSGPAALACDLALFLGRHRREASSLFFLCTHRCALQDRDCRTARIGRMPTAAEISSSMPQKAPPADPKISVCSSPNSLSCPCESYTDTPRLQQIATVGLVLSSKCPLG